MFERIHMGPSDRTRIDIFIFFLTRKGCGLSTRAGGAPSVEGFVGEGEALYGIDVVLW